MPGGNEPLKLAKVELELIRLSQVQVTGLSRRATRRLVLRADLERRRRGEAGLLRRQATRGWWLVDLVLLKVEYPTFDLAKFVLREELEALDERVSCLEDTVRQERDRLRNVGSRVRQLQFDFDTIKKSDGS